MTRRPPARLPLLLAGLLAGGALVPGPAASQDAPAPAGPVGKITDREGTAARRGLTDPRWTPADARALVLPGDWLKTAARGANALDVALDGGARLVLGPGALVEVLAADRLRLHAGEAAFTPPDGTKLVVEAGPGGAPREVTARTVLRAKPGALEALPAPPRWLVGYEERTPTEAVGALLATVDGRDVPLTLGYHKVEVDIRDQLARTEIEESFVNHTPHVLEGVFYFPLPADASISGFSMWIGDEQVHGEIVEKQRARAIYETILREKRDPGLLEWAGGSLFKARVYPITGEKRIKISYTQVLPQVIGEGGQAEVVYHHALASEHLRLHPLKELSVTVTVSSQRKLLGVTVPTHPARVQATDHAARVEVHQQEVAPDRDLEVRLRTERPASGMTLASHVRGDDGYFMLLLDAPTLARTAKKAPVDVLILADTSGSISGPAREAQAAFVAALLEALGPDDTFDLAVFDAELKWAHGRPTKPDPATREVALGLLDGRAPLGWTDLDRAIAAAAERAGSSTQVIYVGDGAVTTGDADPAAFARRAPTRYKGQGSFHAVVPGSTREAAALKAIAALGGGSVRAVGSDPAKTAFDLLAEVTSPRVRDVKLTFEGMAVAAVYPETLPDLPAGAQQVIVGRWDPTTAPKDGLKGKLRLTGQRPGGELSVTHEVALGAAPSPREDDASFIPRLWARAHLDHLLAQGATAEVKQRVIALSEDFQLATPYTSFLVLETEADRERFQVKKRTRMRDGEEFFSRGRDDAEHALRRQTALQARAWRRALRARALEALADMNRGLTSRLGVVEAHAAVGYARQRAEYRRVRSEALAKTAAEPSGTLSFDDGGDEEAEKSAAVDADLIGEDDVVGADEDAPDAPAEAFAQEAPAPAQPAAPMPQSRARLRLQDVDQGTDWTRGRAAQANDRLLAANHAGAVFYAEDKRFFPHTPSSPFDALLPGLPAAPGAAPAFAWPKELTDAYAGLDLRGRVAAGALRVRARVERPDGRGRPRAHGEALWLLSSDRWATASLHREGEDVRLDWLAHAGAGGALQRGALTAVWGLGRARPAEASDVRGWSSPWPFWSLDELASCAAWKFAAAPAADGGVELTFMHPDDDGNRLVLVVDPARKVVRSARGELGAAVTWSIAYDVAEVQGAWWPTAMRRFVGDRLVESTTIQVEVLAPAAFEQALAQTLTPRAQALLLGPAPASLRAARAAVRGGQPTLEERWAVLGALAAAQRWDAARPQLEAVLAAAKDRPAAAVALEATALLHGRRLEELRLLVHRAAEQLVAAARPADVAAANALLGWAGSLADGAERLDLIARLDGVLARRAALTDARVALETARAQALDAADRPDEAQAVLRALVEREPERLLAHTQYAWWLSQHGDPEGAVAHLDQALAAHGPWPEGERQQLAQQAHTILWSGQRHEALVQRFERLERDDPAATAQVLDTYLSSLVMLDRPEAAWERVKAWTDVTGDLPLEGLARARFDSAVRHALGHGPGLWTNALELERAQHLAQVVRALAAVDAARLAAALSLARQVVHDPRWNRSPAGRAAVTELVARLRAEASAIAPAEAVALFQLVRHAGPAADAEPKVWDEVLDAFEARRQALATTDREGAAALDQVILSHGDAPRRLRRLRELHAAATDDDVRPARAALLEAVFQQPWTAELRDEALGLLVGLAPVAQDAPTRDAELAQQVGLLVLLVDWSTQARAEAAVAARPDHGQLDRRRLAAALDEALRASRVEALELLAAAATEATALTDWIALERAWLQVKLGRDRDPARAACAALVDARLAAAPAFGDDVVLGRAVATLLYLIATDDAEAHTPALAAQVERALAAKDARLDWREVKVTLLLLRDDLAGMEAALRGWFDAAGDGEAARWGVPLSHVLAERDRLQEAAEVLERVEALDEAGVPDLLRLGLLYTALDRQVDARAAKVRAWSLVDEWTLASALQRHAGRVSRTGEGVPEALDPDAPLQVMALLRKAQSPEQHVWTVQQLYETTRDFRLLEGLAEGVLGQSAQRVYRLLEALRPLTDSLQEEATLDRLRAAIEGLRARDGTTAVDRRALWLLELLASKGAAAQGQGAEPHLEAATRALREAFALAAQRETTWAPGEPVLYSGLLADLGALPGALGEEQLRQLEALVDLGRDADDRVVLAAHLAAARWAHGQHDAALRALSGALDAARVQGRLAPRHHAWLGALAGYLQEAGRFVDAEALFERELAAGHPGGPARALRLGLHEVRRAALASGAETKLGRGAALYAGARDALLADLGARTTEAHAIQLVGALAGLWQVGAQQRVPGVGDDVTRFAFGELPHVVRAYQGRQTAQLVRSVVDALARYVSPVVALDCLVQQAEAEPRWLRLQHGDSWSQHGWRFGQLLEAAKGQLPEPLAARLLELVKRELRRDLLLERHGPAICWARRSSQFWAAHADAFAQVAREVLIERREVEVTVGHAARYLHDALERTDEGIAALADAERRGVLGWSSRLLLVAWLQQAERFADSLPLVERLVAERPAELQARCLLALALFRTEQPERLTRALADAEAYLRETNAWREPAAATLGALCVQVKRPQDAARLLDEAIALHTRSRPDRGVGGGTLSRYYEQLSQARLQLGDTAGAVDAACGAVVAWGRSTHQRQQALATLAAVLQAAPDLDAFVEGLDDEVARTGLENPTLRRALGQVYRELKRPEVALVQLRRALDAQPNDLEVQRALVEVLDQLQRPAEAADQLQALALAAGHDVTLYVELGRRRAKLGQPGEAERAWTNAVELVPEEAEGHAALAQVREEQRRFADAAERWRQVVRVRTDEPAGWLGLARALLADGRKDEAAQVARDVLGRAWDERFGDVHDEARRLLDSAAR